MMFRPLVRSAEPHEPSGFWSLSRNSTPRSMAAAIARIGHRLGRPRMQLGRRGPAVSPRRFRGPGPGSSCPEPETATDGQACQRCIRSSIHHRTPRISSASRLDYMASPLPTALTACCVRTSSPACSPSRISVLPPADLPILTVRFSGLPSFAGR